MVRRQVTQREFEQRVLEFCYDRDSCRNIGLDYNNLGTKEVKWIRDYLEREQYQIVERVEEPKHL